MTLLLEALGSIARWLLAGLMGYFVGHGVFTQAQADNYTTALAGAAAAGAVSLGWSLWQKYSAHLKVLTALSMPAGSSIDQLQQKIDRGTGAKLVALLLAAAIGGAVLMLSGCATADPNLSSSGKAGANADAVVKRLQELQNAAKDAAANGALPTPVAADIVAATVEVARIAQAAQSGWLIAAHDAWNRWKAKIPLQYRQLPAVSATWVAVEVLFAEYGA
jgi:hypothetical protein